MHLVLIYFMAIVLFLTGSATTQKRRYERDTDGDWSYNDPEDWGGFCNADGTRQSPIDIEIDETTPLESLPLFLGGSYNKKVELNTNENGVTKILSPDPAILDGGSLDGTYAFLSLHFHFGSEHTIDGKRMDAEAHFVHYNLKYDPEDAMKETDGLAVVAILIQVGNDVNTESDLLHKIVNGEQLDTVTLREAFPDNLEPWIRYEGSLTTPPCSENVIWTVILNPVTVPSLPETSSTFRPVQAISNRTIYIRQRDTDSGTMLTNSAATVIFFSIFAQVINQYQSKPL